MNSLKTGVIIAFALTVLYGVYLVINKPEPSAEAKVAAEQTPDLEFGELTEDDSTTDSAPADDLAQDEPLKSDEPAAEIADSGRPGSKFGRSRKVPPLQDEETLEADQQSVQQPESAPEMEETAPAWRKKPQPKPEPDATPEESEPATDPAIEPEVPANPETEQPSETEPATQAEDHTDESEEPVKSRSPKQDNAEKDNAEQDNAEQDNVAQRKVEQAEEDTQSEVRIAPAKAPALTSADFDAAWAKMESEIEQEKLKEALATISPFYHATDLSEDDYKHLVEVLDLLAWRVIFSKEHFLAKPHVVKAGETLEDIAQRYRVPSEVIAKINGVKSAKLLTAGKELKVIPGPFRAEVSAEGGELTLFLGDLYATRYALETGSEPPPEVGEYSVRERSPGAVYRTRENHDIAAQDKRNPYGGYYLDLGNGQCLHGSPEEEKGEALGTGCMRLRGKDAKEVYWLLSKGSKVTVLR